MRRIEKAERIGEILDEIYPEVPIPLDHTDAYTLLVAVALSAQTTDKKVNQITPALFAVAGTPEVIRPGTNGDLVPPGDSAALARAVLVILADDERRRSMAAAAADGLDDFGRDHMVRKLEELYRWMVGSNPC